MHCCCMTNHQGEINVSRNCYHVVRVIRKVFGKYANDIVEQFFSPEIQQIDTAVDMEKQGFNNLNKKYGFEILNKRYGVNALWILYICFRCCCNCSPNLSLSLAMTSSTFKIYD